MPSTTAGQDDQEEVVDEIVTAHFLDMGEDRYGDCILVRAGNRTILVDGGHPRDLTGQAETPSIPEQLETIFGHPPPYDVTLLVVTHGHNDHIGCLPELVRQGIVRPAFALISDPAHCFPEGARDHVEVAEADDAVVLATVTRVLCGLAEEDHGDLPEPELELFLDRAVKLGGRYRGMIDWLEGQGVPVVKWGTSDVTDLEPIYAALDGTGFDVIAPSSVHLELCRDQIVRYATGARDALDSAMVDRRGDLSLTPSALAARLYRNLPAGDFEPLSGIDRTGQGSALNCQSIMLVVGPPDGRILLTGDMQFAENEVTGLNPHMADLLAQVVEAGPFHCVKLPHHTSYNGFTPEIWNRLGRPRILVHSGGSADPSHPEPALLTALAAIDDRISFVRTDRNGLISVSPADATAPIRFTRGTADDFSVNRRPAKRDTTAPIPPSRSFPASIGGTAPSPPSSSPQSVTPQLVDVVIVRLPLDHELIVKPESVTIRRASETGHDAKPPAPPLRAGERLAAGRPLPCLLFVTSGSGLARNIGQVEAERAMALIRRDAKLLDVDGTDAASACRKELGRGGYVGVVLVGGYDILPAERVDVLDRGPDFSLTPADLAFDPDDFIVWSDDAWGDVNDDGMADMPVSRIPDGRSAELVLAALTASGEAPAGAFGIRNAERPFADAIFQIIDPHSPSLKCVPTLVAHLPAGAASKRSVYFMLHGDDRDGSRFWGDDKANRRVVEAINVGALPTAGLDVVFAGCCWGALTVLQRANRPGEIAPRAPEESMALACLRAGARAFVGCTGVHYSPGPGGGFFGAPMHEAFWTEMMRGCAPAEALFRARADYLVGIPHGRTDPREQAIERKIYKQFTCLGLGW